MLGMRQNTAVALALSEDKDMMITHQKWSLSLLFMREVAFSISARDAHPCQEPRSTMQSSSEVR